VVGGLVDRFDRRLGDVFLSGTRRLVKPCAPGRCVSQGPLRASPVADDLHGGVRQRKFVFGLRLYAATHGRGVQSFDLLQLLLF
jgi:hypothetical protein